MPTRRHREEEEEERAAAAGGRLPTILFLAVLGTVVAAFAGRLRVPAPSLLVIAGLAVGLLPGVPTVRVAPDAVSTVALTRPKRLYVRTWSVQMSTSSPAI